MVAWYQVVVEGSEEPAWIFADLADAAGPLDSLERLSEEDLPELPETAAAASRAGAACSAAAVNAPPPSGGGFFGYGVQAHMLGGGIGEAVSATSGMGFNWLKQQVEWRRFEGLSPARWTSANCAASSMQQAAMASTCCSALSTRRNGRVRPALTPA